MNVMQSMPEEAVQLTLGETYPEIRDLVRRICLDFPGSYWRKLDDEEAYPTEFVAALTKAGLLAALIPEEYGGLGLPLGAAAATLEEIHANGCNAGACHAQMYIMGTLLRHGSAEQKQKYLPEIAAGRLRLQAFGVTEPTTGTDTTKLKTRAERRGDHYVLSGQKIWISTAQVANKILILARTTPLERVKRKTEGLSLFYTDLDRSRVAVRVIDKMGRHAVDSNEMFFDGMVIPEADRIGAEGDGFRSILHGMNPERILIAAEAVGIGLAALRRAASYARERVVFRRPIGQNQAIAHPLAQCWMELQAANLMVMKAASLYDRNLDCAAEANAAKYLAAEAAFHACETAVMTHGGMGYSKEFHVERYLREVMIPRIAPITPHMILNFIAEKILGLPKSY